MRAQRVREGESRVEMQIVKWTAEGTGKGDRLVFCDVRHTSVAGRYDGISAKRTGNREFKVAPRIVNII